MKPAATGRILFWRGGSLWIGLAGEPAGIHSHHAVQITLPFPGGRVRFQSGSQGWIAYTAALVVADHSHAFEARAQRVAQIFVDPESRYGRLLHQRYRDAGVVALPSAVLESHTAGLAAAYEKRARDVELIELARATIDVLSGASPEPEKAADARIAQALVLIREGIGGKLSLAAVAAAVHLSPDRLRHLFVQETGVSFRSYVLWLRLECSLAAYVAGQTLTAAAYIGGFADSAHFSRTFKSMFGITPASVRPE
jgi:transcriptional regulator GlxA family with amidase domain